MLEALRQPPADIAGYDPRASADGCRWSPEHAAHAVHFFERYLRLWEGEQAGRPFRLQPWQRDYVATLFGWRRSDDGTRRYRESVFFVPRKNGKTTIMAGLALYMLCCDQEQGGQVYCAAFSQDQATLLFNSAVAMVENSATLSRILRVLHGARRIVHPRSRSFLRAIPADARGVQGFGPQAVFFDELHTQRTRELYDALKSASGARRQPLMISLSTAGHNKASICYELWHYARQVRDGLIDCQYLLPCICEAPEGADWKDEAVWRACNPNFGVSVQPQFLRQEAEKAERLPGYENTFRRYYLNQWTEQAVRWISLDDWDACRGELPDLSGRPCWIGIDLSATTDITAVAAAFLLPDERVALKTWFFVPGERAEQREQLDGVPFVSWASQGHVRLSMSRTIQPEHVVDLVLSLSRTYDIREIVMDPWQGIAVRQRLVDEGLLVADHRQGFASMSGPSKEFERRVIERRLLHDGHPVMRWMIGNTAIDEDAAGNIKPTKSRSGDRIDGVVAAIMAVGRAAYYAHEEGADHAPVFLY